MINGIVKFDGKEINYVPSGQINEGVFIFDLGDGELKDVEGDDYFLHLEYIKDKNEWIEEIWFDDDYILFKEWAYATEQMKKDLNNIEVFFQKEFITSEIEKIYDEEEEEEERDEI